MMTYEQAIAVLEGGRKKHVRKVENNTQLISLGYDAVGGFSRIGVKLHGTYVVIIRSDGTYELDSGGFRTVTTKDRINKYSSADIWAKDGVWYWGNWSEMVAGPAGNKLVAREYRRNWLADHQFEDGMIVDSLGRRVTTAAQEIASGRMWDNLGKAVKRDARRS